LEDLTLTLIDVGGQRSERKKWLYCFESVTSVLFVTSLSEYDQYVDEEPYMNRMHESLKLFESICNIKWFLHATLLLFLNKKDLFEDKIKSKPLTLCFPDYDGSLTSYSETTNHILIQFENQCKVERDIYRHFTCAKDKNNIAKVFGVVKDDILMNTLSAVGLA
jgi:guanine nucleotide-binding protein G(i) subunit alpha